MSDVEERQSGIYRNLFSVLIDEEILQFLGQVDSDWEVRQSHHLERTFRFSDFARALDFTNELGKAAEEDGHHPVIHLSWGKVVGEIWTHELDGLTENDFISAARYDRIYRETFVPAVD